MDEPRAHNNNNTSTRFIIRVECERTEKSRCINGWGHGTRNYDGPRSDTQKEKGKQKGKIDECNNDKSMKGGPKHASYDLA